MKLRFRNLRSRIILFFTILLMIVEGIAFVFINIANLHAAQRTIDEQLRSGTSVFELQLKDRREQLTQAATVLASDFGFREAIATHDLATMDSVLRNHGERIHANLMMLSTTDGVLLADTLQGSHEGQPFPFPALMQEARAQGQASAIKLIDGVAYQLVIVPVKAPLPIAWVAIGFVADDRLAHDLFEVTGLQVSFLGRDADGGWQVLASTLPPAARATLPSVVRKTGGADGRNLSLQLGGQSYESRLTPLGPAKDASVVAVLQRSLDEALAPFKQLRSVLILLAALSLALSVLGSYFVARGITSPLAVLTSSAVRIREGDYSAEVETGHTDEIGVLADSLNHMRKSIAVRERDILRLAYEDPLTGLPNRLMFGKSVQEFIRISQRDSRSFAVLMLDLDRFKPINATLGHSVGDAVLRAVAGRLRGLLGDTGNVARFGGDEFGVVLPVADKAGVIDTVRQIMGVLEAPVSIQEQPIDVGASLGIAVYPTDGDDAPTLIRRADTAMNIAKQNNAGFVFFDPGSETASQVHLSMLGELRRAVEQNELRVYYQPKIDVRTGRACGVEALVRWQHPRRGMVPPLDFISFAERTGYIRAVTRWVLDAALRDCSRWLSEGLDLTIAVNISTRDLLDPELPGTVREMIERYKVPPHLVGLEITESGFMQEPAQALSTLQKLDALGLRLAIDDYGTGYSSLTYLKKLPVDELKVDQSFVRTMVQDANDMAIVRSTIELAQNMRLKVVAEGVEDSACLEQLRRLGCDQAQGYFMSKPLPEEQLRVWLRESRWSPSPLNLAASG